MVDCLLPAMCMVPALTALANEVWGALNLLDCTDRWRIYTALKVRADWIHLFRDCGCKCGSIWLEIHNQLCIALALRCAAAAQAKLAASPLLQAAGKLASVETKKVLRRLHVAGAQDRREKRRGSASFARLLGKASHSNPLAVCSVLIGQVLFLADSEGCDQAAQGYVAMQRIPVFSVLC